MAILTSHRVSILLLLTLLLTPAALGQVAPGKSPVPAAAEVAKSLKEVREVFPEAYVTGVKPAVQVEVAGKMLATAGDAGNSDVSRYVLLIAARDLAVEAGDMAIVESVVTEIANHFAVKPTQLRLDSYVALSKRPLPAGSKVAFVRAALAVVDEAYRQGEYLPAAELLRVLPDIAKATDDRALPAEIAERRRIGGQLYEQQRLAEPAFTAIKAGTATPQQKADAGRFLAFVRDNWADAAPLLSAGNDEALKKIAEAEIAMPATAEAQGVLADLLFAYSETAAEWIRPIAQRRAAQYYRKALPGLAGIAKIRAEKRISTAGAVAAVSVPESATTGNVKAGKIVLWNQHNASYGDRGAKTANVIFFLGAREIARRVSIEIPWERDRGKSVDISPPDQAFDRLRVELTDWRGSGGGLAEIQVFKGETNVAPQAVVLASESWGSGDADRDYGPHTVIDGETDPGQASRHWLLPDNAAGWIELEWTPLVDANPAATALSKTLGYPLRRHPTSAASVKGHWYVAYVGRISWNEAAKRCRQLGGHLVTMNTLEENNFCWKLAKKQRFWAGGLRDATTGRFRWVDGTNMNLPGWERGQPDNAGGTEDRLEVYERGWNDCGGEYDANRGFICEWPF